MSNKIIKTIDRSLQVLELFSLEKSEWGITEISEELNLYKSNVYNILYTLSQRGFVEKNPNNDKYKLSIKLYELGSVVLENLDIREIALPHIKKLSNKYNETVHLGVLDKDHVISIEQKESPQSLKPTVFIGKRTPLYCTAVGKAILANFSEQRLEKYLENNKLKKYTENTITDKNVLKKELKKIKEQGYSIDQNEHEEGINCVAAPIKDHNGTVTASISISGPASRINDKNINELAQEVKKSANEISEKLGNS